MNKSSKAPRRRGRNKEDGGGVGDPPSSTSFHAPLIQFNDDVRTWYEYGKDLPGRDDSISTSSSSSPSPALVRQYRSMADSIYANELRLFKQGQNGQSAKDEHWVENTMRKGTLKDRIAAMAVTLSGDPLHKFYALDGLMSMVGCSTSDSGSGGGKTNSRVAQLTAEALEDLFINTLLPPNRKLLTLAQRPLSQYEDEYNNNPNDDNEDIVESGNKKKNKNRKKSSSSSSNVKKTLSPRILLLWRFEELIREKYDLYLRQYMAQTLQDGVELQKIATLRSASNLLSSNPEGEIQLLNMMVNKLGDPEKKTVAAAGHQLRIVLQEHTNMQTVVAREVQQLAHRPQLSPKALYNCIVFLNQLQLRKPTATETETADSHTFSLPASLIKTYFRLFEVAVAQDKIKKRKKSSSKSSSLDGTMKSRLLSALLTGVNRAHPYLPEKDRDMEEHVDALYRIVHTSPPGACTQALMLLFHLAIGSQVEDDNDQQDDKEDGKMNEEQLSQGKTRQKDRFYRALYATLTKGNMVSNGKHMTMYFNVLYKAMKYDTDINRVHVFSKRLLSAMMHAPPPSIAASMYLLQEISTTHEGLRQSWEDIPDPETNSWLVLDDTKREPKAGLVNIKDMENGDQQKNDPTNSDISYHPKGNPPCWEIALLKHHFHPSVSKFVNDIGQIDYAGDPLQDFGLAPFLDKFAYRNPKSREKLMQKQQQTGNGTGSRRNGKPQTRFELPVNDPSFLDRTDVGEQDEFFHQFFLERARRDELKGVVRNNSSTANTEDDDDDDDDEGVRDDAQVKALDAAEETGGLDGGGKAFEEYEAMWETDDEEEAFVDNLAQSLMEDAAGGPVDIDDGLDDTGDWGDLYADESDQNVDMKTKEDETSKSDESDEEDVEEDNEGTKANKKNQDNDGGEDAFMEDADSDSDSQNDDLDNEPNIDEEKIMSGFGGGRELDDDYSDDDGDDLGAFLAEDESDEDEAEDVVEEIPVGRKSKKPKKDSSAPIFASADEYEEMIEASFSKLNRAAITTEKTENNPVQKESSLSNKKSKKGKKNRKRS